jgi:uncharacterized protein (TIGR00288 family)
MNSRHTRTPTRVQSALIHRGPQAMTAAPHVPPPFHAPNAALLIDFDNVTMGIRSDLGKELRSLLSSEIIKGKVAVQRAYADWRRYPQYIVPLSEASIDLIFAPAYGSSKKNATDIRLAIDALELVFTRPEIGTFILLSGDSDFSSLVIKLKEYGKYVIGVGIRESSSDLLVQNCDEYYSYNALAGLVKANDDEVQRKYDPWELVTEAVQRMKRNNDVMRSDRLKQVMQEIDSTFDEKNLGISKFSRFCQEAAQRGLLSVTKLDNGQLEVDLPAPGGAVESQAPRADGAVPTTEAAEAPSIGDDRPRRSRRGRGGRGRDREDREARPDRGTPAMSSPSVPAQAASVPQSTPPAPSPHAPAHVAEHRPRDTERQTQVPLTSETIAAPRDGGIGSGGERLTRAEAFDLVRRTVADVVPGDETVRASDVRRRAREILGRDSESLTDRMFVRILKDAHDEGIIDLRRRGDDFEVARAAEAAPVSEQLARTEQAAVAASSPPAGASAPAPRLGMGPRGAGPGRAGPRGRPGAPPPGLLSIGVVEDSRVAPPPPIEVSVASDNGGSPTVAVAKPSRGGRGRGKGAKPSTPATHAAPATVHAVEPAAAAPVSSEAKATRPRAAAKKATGRPRAKKAAGVTKVV